MIAALSALGPQAAIGALQSPAAATGAAPGAATPATGSTSFSSQLTGAINSLDQSQQTASTDAQGLSTGTIADPTQAVTAVENASLEMDLAAQIRDKLVTATNTIFQTQV
jgi:flagellar hook-basal body complex protein FliE